jgi:hypothetical protein
MPSGWVQSTLRRYQPAQPAQQTVNIQTANISDAYGTLCICELLACQIPIFMTEQHSEVQNTEYVPSTLYTSALAVTCCSTTTNMHGGLCWCCRCVLDTLCTPCLCPHVGCGLQLQQTGLLGITPPTACAHHTSYRMCTSHLLPHVHITPPTACAQRVATPV